MGAPDLLIGRESELENVRHLHDSNRLVTVVGPGGVGKTTLVHAAVADSANVLFGRLAPLPESDLADALAGSLGFRSFAAMSDALTGQKALIVLDNCEHVVDAAAGVAEDLLDRHPGISILATSREPLAVSGERVFPLGPLSTVGDPSPAADLFVTRMVERGLAPPDDLADIEALCTSLDGLPLALELAASRTSALTARDINENLGTRLDLLSRRRSRGPERHRSITAAVGWSVHLLEPDLQDLFMTVSVFDGTFTARMANTMAARDDIPAVADDLAALVERSLLVHEPANGRSWYRMLSTIRAYGAERLEAEGRWVELNDRLVDQAAEAGDRLAAASLEQDDPSFGPETGQLFRVFRSAIDWCLVHDESPDRASRLVLPLWGLEDTGFQAEAADAIQAVIDRWEVDDARMYGSLAMMARSAGQFTRAEEAAERAIQGDGIGVVLGYRILGLTARAAGRYKDALDLLQTGSELASELGLPGMALELQAHRALATARQGKVEESVAMFADVESRSGEHRMVATMAPLMAGLMLVGEDIDRSIEATTRSLAMADEIDYLWAQNHAREQLALASYLSGDELDGMARMADTVEYAAANGSRSETWLGLRFIERMFASRDRMELAAASYAAAIRTFGDPAVGPSEQAALDAIWSGTVDPADAATIRIPELCAELRDLAGGTNVSSTHGNRFVRNGDIWELSFAREQALLSATKGLADIAELLARPGAEVAAIDLMGAGVVSGDAGPASDAQARRSYEERIRELQRELEEAEANNDSGRAEKATIELDALVGHLAAAYGLRGDQRTVGDVAEKARTAVTWRIRSAIKKVGAEMPTLGEHLDRSIRTGRFCSYAPDQAIDWQLTA